MYTMTIDTATMILGRTSALGAAEAIVYDVSANDGPVTFGSIKRTIWNLLEPINDLLHSPLHSNGQIAGASKNVRGQNGKQRMVNDDYTARMSLDEANQVFHARRNFGAVTIDELVLAIGVATAHQKRDAVDEIISISMEEEPQGALLKEMATEEVEHIKAELVRLSSEVDKQMKQIADVFDRPLPSQRNDSDRLIRNRQVSGLM